MTMLEMMKNSENAESRILEAEAEKQAKILRAEASKVTPKTQEEKEAFKFPQIQIDTLKVNDLIIGDKTFDQILSEIYDAIAAAACKCNSSDK